MTKVIVTGGAGQLGQAFSSLALKEVVALDRQQLDISKANSIRQAIQLYQPTVVINAAAYTNVEQAELEPEQAFSINEKSAALLAQICAEQGIQLIHLSTDYVFDGEKGQPYEPLDQTNPINCYGQSKLAGEKAVLLANSQVILVRSSWLYSEFGNNFQTKILQAAKDKSQLGEALRVVSDEWGTPTYAPDLVTFLLLLAQKAKAYQGQILHFSSNQVMSRLQMAEMLLTAALQRQELKELPKVEAALAKDYPTVAKRSRNSALRSSELRG
ncbi:MAG: dTDP-4-dehydrorhamnose reductase [Alcaligenaceae bacterium]|jgi:dTDP-4-dehydrorhamnose reductase|nr:dTDP-4-dehydrorhamnose reductase [Alcaligenaceae bacterium]HZJ97823.1 dTDP-4-dehydrorhamnose reductase [Oligella sp.]